MSRLNWKISGSLVSLALLASCAQNPKQIHPIFVGHERYTSMSCLEMSVEAQSVSRHAAILAGKQSQEAAQDVVAVGAGLLLFFPTLYMVEGNSANAAKLAHLKGEADAIEHASRINHCGIDFRS